MYERDTASFSFLIQKLKLIFRWNFWLMVFGGNIDSVVIPSSLEFRTLHITSFASAMSFTLCMFMNIVTIYVIGMIVYVVLDIQREEKKIHPENSSIASCSASHKWLEVQAFHIGYKKDSLRQHLFMFIYLSRLYLFYVIISHMYSYPLLQASMIACLNAGIVIYILIAKPFTSKLVFCQCLIDELILLAVNSLILTLAIFDHQGIDQYINRVMIGSVIIILNVAICIVDDIFLLAYIYNAIINAIAQTRKHKGKGAIAWIAVLLSPFENGGMDFEASVANNGINLTPSANNGKLIRKDVQDSIKQSFETNFFPHGRAGRASNPLSNSSTNLQLLSAASFGDTPRMEFRRRPLSPSSNSSSSLMNLVSIPTSIKSPRRSRNLLRQGNLGLHIKSAFRLPSLKVASKFAESYNDA